MTEHIDKMKQSILNRSTEERREYFFASSSCADFTNSQYFYNSLAKKYNLSQDGQFNQLCSDMKASLGLEVYTELMDNLVQLRDAKAKEIKDKAPEFLTHTSGVSPKQIGNKLLAKNNLNQFGEDRGDFVFATESESERDFYALRSTDKERKNVNWKKRANVDGKEENVFIMEKINQDSYSYFLSKEKFTPVVCLDGRFGHEWTATEDVQYSKYEKNNVEDIKNRNIVKIVNRDRFYSKTNDPSFMSDLDNPDKIIDSLDNSGVFHSNADEKIANLRNRINKSDTKTPFKPTQDLSKIDFNTLKMYQDKKQNG